jgi:hypothetical protein
MWWKAVGDVVEGAGRGCGAGGALAQMQLCVCVCATRVSTKGIWQRYLANVFNIGI